MTISLTKAYDRVKSIDWDLSYVSAEAKLVEKTRFFLEGPQARRSLQDFRARIL